MLCEFTKIWIKFFASKDCSFADFLKVIKQALDFGQESIEIGNFNSSVTPKFFLIKKLIFLIAMKKSYAS